MFRKIITYLTIYSFMFSNVCWAAMITPDGRTQTTVNVNGHVYDVTTSTVSGQNAFNSFSNFDVYKGTTVNLYLPGSTLNLINLVRDGKTNIDGILNSIKNGKIGGNVFILNPHGIAIGKSGVVNVGSLMLSTPNKEFMDQVIGQDGSISELATKSVLAGDLPINPAGVISVKGKIKALDSVAVRAGGAEALFMMGGGEVTMQAVRYLKADDRNFVVFVNRYFSGSKFIRKMGEYADGIYILSLPSLSSNPDFAEDLVRLRLWGIEPDGLMAYGYLSVKMWEELVNRAGGFVYENLQKSLNKQLIRAGWGTVVYTDGEPDRSLKYAIYRFENGEYAQVY